ncbi:ATP phosphoribosyltransferase (ATP-PRTase) (ATP-PRT) [Nowakowskiella sp. JEL0407]|nr:ATP phosphoribosyltransferase (ATP-PRTase) (ATP-PRT) [Nowakowskiella sp. JEL0407]
MDFSDLQDRLLFAVPKKGRLHEQCTKILAGADIQYTRSNRLDIALSTNLPLAIVFLPAADIAQFVGNGNVDLGITGQDIIAETNVQVDEILELGFGKCNLSVQVPINSGFKSAEDLVGKRVVTSFDGVAKRYFEDLEKKVAEKGVKVENKTQIHYVSGSVEAACALGLADGIIDLVESGETMRAAKLHAIDTVLKTQAVLICNPNKHASNPLIETLKRRIQGVIAAQKFVLCEYNIRREKLDEAKKITPGRRAPTVSALEEEGWIAVQVMVGKEKIVEIMDQLVAIGAEDIVMETVESCLIQHKDVEYNVNNPIARGGMSSVYSGKWAGIDVAVKLIRDFSNKSVIESLLEEFAILVRLRHQNIVLLYGVSMDTKNALIILEYADGGSLYSYIQQNPSSIDGPRIVNRLLHQIALGMTYLHSRSPPIIHGDLKLSNCLIHNVKYGLGDAVIKLTDFGMSRIRSVTESTHTKGSVGGTLRWISPERLRGGKLNEAVDVYAFSMTSYEVITIGKIPFELDDFEWANDFAIMDALYNQVRPIRPTLPSPPVFDEEHWKLITECWDQNPSNRPSFASIINVLGDLEGKFRNTSAVSNFSQFPSSVNSLQKSSEDTQDLNVLLSIPKSSSTNDTEDSNLYLTQPGLSAEDRIRRWLNLINQNEQSARLGREFHPGTRQWIVDEIIEWSNDPKSRTLWITGGAGIGKSVVAYLLSASVPQESFGSVFYCSRSDPDRKNFANIIKSISHDLALKFPEYMRFLEQVLDKDIKVVAKGNQSIINTSGANLSLFLLSRGLKAIPTKKQLVLLIDGIDECEVPDQRKDLLTFIKSAESTLPPFVKLVVTGRMVTEIWDELNTLERKVIECTSENNIRDLKVYIESRIDKFGFYSSEELSRAADTLAKKSNGNFRYARFACDAMEKENLLEISDVLRLINSPKTELFETCDFAELSQVISTASHLKMSLSVSGIYRLLNKPSTLASSVELALKNMLNTDSDETIKRYFASIRGKAEYFGYQTAGMENALAESCFQVLYSELRFNTAQIDKKYFRTFRDRIPNINHILASVPDHLRYAVSLASAHLETISKSAPNDTATRIFSSLMGILMDKLPFWIELLALTQPTFDPNIIFAPLITLFTNYDSPASLVNPLTLIQDIQNSIKQFYTAITACPFQIYFSAIPLSSSDSVFYQRFKQSLPSAIGGIPKNLKEVAISSTGKISVRTLTGHSSDIRAVAIDPNGNRIVSASGDATLKIWNADTGKEEKTLYGHRSYVLAVAISKDGMFIVSGSSDKTLRVWESQSGKEIRTFMDHYSSVCAVAMSSNGRIIVSGSQDKSVKIWDLNSGKNMRTLTGHSLGVRAVAISDDGSKVVSGSQDKKVKIWDVNSGNQIGTLVGHNAEVLTVAITHDGKRIVSGSNDKAIIMWDSRSGEIIQKLPYHSSEVFSVAISGNGSRIVSGCWDGSVRLWESSREKKLQTLSGHTSAVYSVASSNGYRIVSGSNDKTVKIWDIEPIISIALDVRGEILKSSFASGEFRLWSIATGEEIPSTTAFVASQINSYLLNSSGWVCKEGTELFWIPSHLRGNMSCSSSTKLVILQNISTTLFVIDMSDFTENSSKYGTSNMYIDVKENVESNLNANGSAVKSVGESRGFFSKFKLK